jgi:hypothetical protein
MLALRYLLLPVGLFLILGGATTISATYDVHAPFDSYVCFSISFSDCVNNSKQLSPYSTFMTATYAGVFSPNSLFPLDPDAGKVTSTASGKFQYQCDNGKISYQPTHSQSAPAAVVFISPSLLIQIAEQMLSLQRIREACSRMVDDYNFQIHILAAQDNLSLLQGAVQYLSANEEEIHIVGLNDNVSNPTITPADLERFGFPPSEPSRSLADALKTYRFGVADQSRQLRTSVADRTLAVEYKNKFADAQSAIYFQLRAIAQNLLTLDSMILDFPPTQNREQKYPNGTWVTKGTIVLVMTR